MKPLPLALAIGTAITLALFGLSFLAAGQGAEGLSYALYWQSYIMYMMLPCNVSITPGEFLCESMKAARITFYSGIPVGIVIYSTLAYFVLRRRAAAPAA